jgi:hypothetical protein
LDVGAGGGRWERNRGIGGQTSAGWGVERIADRDHEFHEVGR